MFKKKKGVLKKKERKKKREREKERERERERERDFIVPCGKFGSLYLGMTTAAARAALPIPNI